MIDSSVIPSIDRLVALCRPLAVFWFVVPFVVNSVNAAPIGDVAHISIEVGKQLPSVAHRDSASTVIGEGNVVWVGASLDHLIPYGIDSCMGLAVGFIRSGELSSPATTAFCAIAEVANPHKNSVPAITQAFPNNNFSPAFCDRIFSPTGYRKPEKPLSRYIFDVCHVRNYTSLYTGIKWDSA